MDPWTILGWLIVVILFFMFGIRIVAALIGLVAVLIHDLANDRRLRRANRGKVRCEDRECVNIATRRTPRGYYCEDHWLRASRRTGAVSYGFPLNHTKTSQEDK